MLGGSAKQKKGAMEQVGDLANDPRAKVAPCARERCLPSSRLVGHGSPGNRREIASRCRTARHS